MHHQQSSKARCRVKSEAYFHKFVEYICFVNNREKKKTTLFFLSCQNSYVNVNNDITLCGKKTGLIYQACTENMKIQFVTGATAYKGMKLFYESTDKN